MEPLRALGRDAATALGLSLCVFMTAACSSPSGPSQLHPAAGTWSGTIQDDARGSGTMQLVLEHRPGAVEGTWSHSLVGAVRSGRVGGQTLFEPLILVLICDTAGGFGSSLVVTVSGNQMTGSYTPSPCLELGGGDVDLTRQ
jgi:hypothetical protein